MKGAKEIPWTKCNNECSGLDELVQSNMVDATNWEGEAGGRGVRALTRYIYTAPPGDNLTTLNKMYKTMTGFMIVRHPFVRLVSAYEDKMLNPHPFPFNYHHKIQEQIKSRRQNKNKKIHFPKDLLNSAKYQHMLRNQVCKLHLDDETFHALFNCRL